MITKEALTSIQTLIGKDKLKEAFEALDALDCDNATKHDLTTIKGNFSHIENKDLIGVVRSEEHTISLNKIRDSLMTLTDKLITELPTSPKLLLTMELTPIDIDSLDYEHCLRPVFSKTLIHELFNRRHSLNLIGEEGKGKSRQLADMKQLCQSLGIHAACVNLKEFRKDYELFVQNLAAQLDVAGQPIKHIKDLLAILTKRRESRFLIMIDNLAVLNDYTSNDVRYNADFVSSLNFLKNNDNTQLFCASKEWLKEVCFDGETSLLELQKIEMPILKDIEIEKEICRRAVEVLATHREWLRKKVRDRLDAYRCLDNLLFKVLSHYEASTFSEKMLAKWIKGI